MSEDWELEQALGDAAGDGDWQRVLALLRQGANPHAYCQAHGMSVLAHAAWCGQLDVAETILAAGVSALVGHDPKHTSPLCQAILGGNPDMVRLLVRSTWNCASQRDAERRTLLMYAVDENVDEDVVQALLDGLRFSRHTPQEQDGMRRVARQNGRDDLLALFSREDPTPVPEATRQARERGIKDIELGRTKRDGVSYLPQEWPECIDFHDIDGRGRSNVGHVKTPWALGDRDQELWSQCGAQWFDPFIEKLKRDESFRIEDLERAHLEATGRPIKFNTIEI